MNAKKVLAILISALMVLNPISGVFAANTEGTIEAEVSEIVASEEQSEKAVEEAETEVLEETTEEVVENEAVSVENTEVQPFGSEDDGKTIISVSDARETDLGETVTVLGKVTRYVDGYWYIQDSDAGIAVVGNLTGGNIVKVTGSVENDNGTVYIAGTEVEVVDDGEAPAAAKEVTIDDIYTGKYQGMLVSLIGNKIVSMDSENITIKDNDNEEVVGIKYYTELNGGIMVNAKIDITAIATTAFEAYVLRPGFTEDIVISRVPQEISTEEELDAVRNNMYGNYILMNDIELTKYWVPIGNADNRFYGTFNANGHTISNVDIQQDLEYWYQYAGFFGYLGEGANVANLTVNVKDGGSVKAKTTSGSTYCGGIAAASDGATVDNCYFYGKIDSATYVGGIVGYASNTTIKNINDYDVNGITGGSYVGGLAGRFGNGGKISSCTLGGSIGGGSECIGGAVGCYASDSSLDGIGASTKVSGGQRVGGLIGQATGSFDCTNCSATGDVTGSGNYVGGFVGYASGTTVFNDCYATGDVKAGGDYAGGFVGYNSRSITVNGCYAMGRVSGASYVGGFIGCSDNEMYAYNSYALGSVTATGSHAGGFVGRIAERIWQIGNCYAKGDVYCGGDYAGGFVGDTYTFSDRNSAKITNSYATGNVRGASYVGGFIGDTTKCGAYGGNYFSGIRNCYALGGKIVGSSYVGGFIGRQTYGTYIEHCYANNYVSPVSASAAFVYNDEDSNIITRCYYNSDNTVRSDSVAVGKTSEQLKKTATYLDWDFVNTWEVNPSLNSGYPCIAALGGSVAEEEIQYIEISTEAELINIRENPTANYKLMKDITLSKGFVPIPEFYGIFDGNGHKITGFELADREEYAYTKSGLFGTLNWGSIVKDLTIEGNIVNSSGSTGFLAGVSYARIINCKASGSIDCTANYSTGGLIGESYFIIENSSADVEIKNGSATDNVGGFVGKTYGGRYDSCTASGSIAAKSNVGGFVGNASGYPVFNDCSAKGDVNGTSYVGGFVGAVDSSAVFNDCYATDCYATGDVKASGDYAGGFVGYSDTSITANGCYATGRVSGASYVGGFIGCSDNEMYAYNSYALGSVTATGSHAGGFVGRIAERIWQIGNCYAKGDVYCGGDYAGGFVGDTYTFSDRNSAKITNSYATGNVRGAEYVGGFIGDTTKCGAYGANYFSDIRNCYALGGKIVGSSYVGGFIGRQTYGTYIEHCYANNYVSPVWTSAAFVYNDEDSNLITRCYYNSDNTVLSDSVAVGKTSEQLKSSATYLDWDFAKVWDISADKNDGYPYLREAVKEASDDEEYTLISTEQELINIRYNLNGKYKLANDITLKYNWIPIGKGGIYDGFCGVLDGDGHTIYGFNVPCDEEYEFEYAAMFSSISPTATIKNLNIVAKENGGVQTKNFGSTNKYAAGIAAMNYGTIQDCTFKGTVKGEYIKGGIAAVNRHTIENCAVEGTITGSNNSAGGIAGDNYGRIAGCKFSGTIDNTLYSGGIVGYNRNSVLNCETDNAAIKGNEYTGGTAGVSNNNITGCAVKNTGVNGTNFIGGIVGRINSSHTISGCTTENTSVSGNNYLGGILGYAQENITIKNCTPNVNISGNDYIGGLVGYVEDYDGLTAANNTVNAVIDGGSYIGGLAGRLYGYGNIYNCVTSGNINASSYAGGIIGYGQNRGSTGYIENCNSSVDIISRSANGSYFGGLTGYIVNSSITNCYATGNIMASAAGNDNVGGLAGYSGVSISKSYATGSVSGRENVGGLVGQSAGDVRNCFARGNVFGNDSVGGLIGYNSSTAQFNYSTGYVQATGDQGGCVGHNGNSILNSYYDAEASGQGDKGKGIGKSTFELKNQMNYISWDFDEIWTRNDAYNNGYPYLVDVEVAQTGEDNAIEIYTEQDLRNISANLNGSYKLMNNIALTSDWEILGDGNNKFNGKLDGCGYTISNVSVQSENANVGFFGFVSACAEIKNLTIEIADNGAISGTSSNSTVGGLAAKNYGRITNCFVIGDVTGQSNAGALVAANYGIIEGCGTKGSVNGVESVGGLVGENYLSVKASYSECNIAGTKYVGGLVGYNYHTVINSYATGNVTARGEYAGGLVGRNDGTVSYSSASNNVKGTNYVAGFAGYNNGNISNSSAATVVSGTKYVGGFAGYNANGKSVQNSYAVGEAFGSDSYAGGFIGRVESNSTITNCYASVKVSDSRNSSRGGFIGSNSGSVTSCYFDKEKAGITNTSGGTSKNTTEMYTPSTYSGWDLENTWQFNDTTPGYPYLVWQSEIGQAPSVVPAISISINAPKTTIKVGETLTYSATLTPSAATDNVIWTSSDSNTVKITSKGVIVGLKPGTAVITAKAGIVSADVTVNVENAEIGGNIVSINKVADIHVPFGSTKTDAQAALPDSVDVILDNASLIALPISWSYVDSTEYEFEGTVELQGSITNTNSIKTSVNVIVDPEPVEPSSIASITDTEISVSYGTTFDSAYASLPDRVEVTLANGMTETLLVAWNNQTEPAYLPFVSGEYVLTGNAILPANGSIVNTTDIKAVAKITVEPMPEQVRNITGAVTNQAIDVVYGTTLAAVKELLPTAVYAVVDGPKTEMIQVVWSNDSEIGYNKYKAGAYTFVGTFVLPESGMITNVNNIKSTITVNVLPSEAETKTLYVSDAVAEIGGTVAVAVSIDSDSKAAAGSICVDYDNDILTPIGYEIGEAIEGTSAMVNLNFINPETGKRCVKVSFAGSTPITTGGEIVKLSFFVNADTADNTQTTVSVSDVIIRDINEVPVPIAPVSGNISAISLMLGDINNDGNINILDALRIVRYDVGFIKTLTDREKLSGDVNKDGNVDIVDAMLIQRFDIGFANDFSN